MSDLPAAFSGMPGYAQLDAPVRRALLESGRIEHLPQGKWLFGEGDVAEHPVLILRGLGGIYRSVASRTVLMGIVGAGTLVGQLPHHRGELPYTAIARTELSVARFLHMPDTLAPFLLGLQARQLATTLQRTADRAHLPPIARIAAEISYLAEQSRPDPIAFSQQEIAEMIGLSRKTVNRFLKTLENHGLVEIQYSKVIVHDIAKLQAVSIAYDRLS